MTHNAAENATAGVPVVAYIVHEPDIRGNDHWFCDAGNYAAKVEAMVAGVRLTALVPASALATMREALELHVAYEKVPTDRGGKNGPKGRAWAAFVTARDRALGGSNAE